MGPAVPEPMGRQSIMETGVTSAAVPVMKHSLKEDSSSGLMWRSTTSMPWRRAT